MANSIVDKNVDFRVGLSDISYLNSESKQPKLPEKIAMPLQEEAISSHVDALWPVNEGQQLLETVCCISEDDMNMLMKENFYNFSSDALQWLLEVKNDKSVDETLFKKAQNVVEELATMETELQINRKLLVQP